MIMVKGADTWERWFSERHKISIIKVEVTDAARELASSHLCGPTAGLLLAEALAGVSLLGGEWTQPDETLTMRVVVDGPLRGLLVEVAADGRLRGYTNVKVMNELDEIEELDAQVALGERAEFQVVRSVPGRVIASGAFVVEPGTITRGVEEYYTSSLQRKVMVQTSALSYGGYIESARGVLFECMPDGDLEVFQGLAGYIEDGSLSECLESGAAMATICATAGLDDAVLREEHELRFGCRCTLERVEGLLNSLPVEDLEELVEKGAATDVYCHMCGKGYVIGVERVAEILGERRAGRDGI